MEIKILWGQVENLGDCLELQRGQVFLGNNKKAKNINKKESG